MIRPKISVVIPVYNREDVLAECLAAACGSEYPDFEVIVVDDASTDRSAEVASRFPCRLIGMETNSGSAAARNEGARQAAGEILAFIDADIIVKKDTLQKMADTLDEEHAAAVVGVYSSRHRNPNAASQYKNLWIRYTYLTSPRHISWVFTSVTAIRKDVFLQAGGFSRGLRSESGIDDLEFGMRVADAGHKIVMNPEVEVEHTKEFSFTGFVRNQYTRSKAFTAFALRAGRLRQTAERGRFANVTTDFTLGIALAYLMVFTGICAIRYSACLYLFFTLALLYAFLNVPFLLFFRRHHSVIKTLKACVILFLDHLVCGFGVLAAGLSLTKRHSDKE